MSAFKNVRPQGRSSIYIRLRNDSSDDAEKKECPVGRDQQLVRFLQPSMNSGTIAGFCSQIQYLYSLLYFKQRTRPTSLYFDFVSFPIDDSWTAQWAVQKIVPSAIDNGVGLRHMPRFVA